MNVHGDMARSKSTETDLWLKFLFLTSLDLQHGSSKGIHRNIRNVRRVSCSTQYRTSIRGKSIRQARGSIKVTLVFPHSRPSFDSSSSLPIVDTERLLISGPERTHLVSRTVSLDRISIAHASSQIILYHFDISFHILKTLGGFIG